MNFKDLEKKYGNMDDEKWEKLTDAEKKECDMYSFERFMRTSLFSPVRDERKKGVLEEFNLMSNEENTYDIEIKEFSDNLEPIENMVDKVYSNLINEELIFLDDFIPPIFLSEYAISKRMLRFLEEENVELTELDWRYHEELFNSDSIKESVLFVIGEMVYFLEKYPQYSQLIPDYDAFVKYREKLLKELKK